MNSLSGSHSQRKIPPPVCQHGRAGTSWRTYVGLWLLAASLPAAWAQDWVSAYKKLSLEELMNLEVTSVSRHAGKLLETPSAIQVITGEDIRRSGVTSIPEALRLASNLSVAQIDSRQWAISARGFNSTSSNKLLVMIDGRTVYTPLFGGVYWDVQDTLLEDVDRIEVISGPGATLWGANAVNGVINLTTKSASETQGLLLLGGGGTELRGFAGVRYGGEIAPNLHYRVYAKYFDRDSSVRFNGQNGNNDWHMGQSGFRLDWNASDSDLFTVQGDYYGGRIAQTGRGDIEVTGGNVIGRWSHQFSPDADLRVQWYFDRTHRNIPASFTEDLDTYDFDLQHHFITGERHNVVWGVGYRMIDDHVENPPGRGYLPGDISREVFSGFAQDEITLAPDRITLTLGTKVEHNDYTGWEYQPSTRLAWKLSPTQTVWSAISRAVRTPARNDRELYYPRDPPFTVAGGPGFDSEKLVAYELGYRAQPVDRLSLTLSGYYNDYSDLRSVERIPPPTLIGNGLEGESYGAELTANYRATDWWRLQMGYTRLIIKLRPKPGSTDTSGASNESHDANYQLSLRSSLDLPGDWEFDAGFRYVGEIANQAVPSYSELEMRLGWRPTDRLEISLVGQNLLRDRHVEFNPPASTTSPRHELERSVYGKVTWRY